MPLRHPRASALPEVGESEEDGGTTGGMRGKRAACETDAYAKLFSKLSWDTWRGVTEARATDDMPVQRPS